MNDNNKSMVNTEPNINTGYIGYMNRSSLCGRGNVIINQIGNESKMDMILASYPTICGCAGTDLDVVTAVVVVVVVVNNR